MVSYEGDYNMDKELLYWIWLSMVPGIGSRKFLSIFNRFPNIEDVYYAKESDFYNIPYLSRKDIYNIQKNKDLNKIKKYLAKVFRQNIKILLYKDSHYPKLLKEIYDPPPVLYYRGVLPINELAISIVGSRRASFYGLKMTEKIAFELASLGICIVSGMAKGIDSYAHRGAIQAKGKTIAVLGCGVDVIYPIENSELMKEIERNGMILSEYPISTLPKANNFPARNRIISGLSLGTIVIEAGDKSGSLITAEFALEQGRNVYAMPGNVDSINSRGTNKLIKEGAKVVTDVQDIIEDLIPYIQHITSYKNLEQTMDSRSNFKNLSVEEVQILEMIKLGCHHGIDIINSSRLPPQTVYSSLTMLEIKGFIVKHGSQYHIKY